MTCIVGYIDKKKKEIVMGADSIASDGFTKNKIYTPKVFRKGKFIIGYTSSFRMGQLIQYKFKTPVHKKGISTDKYLSTIFIDKLMKCFKDSGYSTVFNNTETGGTFLVGYDGRLFRVQNDNSILEVNEEYASCGSGVYHALGALYVMNKIKNNISINNKVLSALESAEYNVTTVSSPFTILRGGKKLNG